MRRTARALSVALVAGAALALTGPTAFADHPVQAGARECSGTAACPDGNQTCTEPRAPQQPYDGSSHDGLSRGGDPCAPAGVQHGVEAGQGGSFTDSVPALVAGGILVATACAGAGYRLRGHLRTTAHRPAGV
ncbi:hypothetical protein A6P39_010235 [Streptomyces sp. FXJ1.172]|uniref:hypothetical protein n=1 Tax=Streptomyces sp. FXJ1.172 TaxID=710705 RepID=UPI0007CF2A6E|nr:hypothetical protein [Streptomyces sp. FXJ1.172]WEP00507.1 hypothetical protein A6P39_010235 [Streptomyces sp. FXJ1.172]